MEYSYRALTPAVGYERKSKPHDLWLCPIWDPAGVDALFQPRGA